MLTVYADRDLAAEEAFEEDAQYQRSYKDTGDEDTALAVDHCRHQHGYADTKQISEKVFHAMVPPSVGACTVSAICSSACSFESNADLPLGERISLCESTGIMISLISSGMT